ncbi:MAG: glycosyltransferase [Bdellovibrionales bacterium]|nr:glycosyltransferase [Bdellovibrionales bacterium]
MATISAVIITKNEEKNIFRCLDSLQGLVEEIIVVDSFSVDGTPQICRAFSRYSICSDGMAGIWRDKELRKQFGSVRLYFIP